MSNFTKEQENYIQHEVQLRLHETKFYGLEKAIDNLDKKLENSIDKLDRKLENSIDNLDKKLDKSVERLDSAIEKLDNKIEASIQHLDNKFMLMFSVVLGSIWLPAILHYLHLT